MQRKGWEWEAVREGDQATEEGAHEVQTPRVVSGPMLHKWQGTSHGLTSWRPVVLHERTTAVGVSRSPPRAVRATPHQTSPPFPLRALLASCAAP